MVDLAVLRRLALALPGVVDESTDEALKFAFGGRGLAWTYMERTTPSRPRRPRLDVLAVRCDLARKEMLLEAAPDRFFDDEHYSGYPAILVRLGGVEAAELAPLLVAARDLAEPPRKGAQRERSKDSAPRRRASASSQRPPSQGAD